MDIRNDIIPALAEIIREYFTCLFDQVIFRYAHVGKPIQVEAAFMQSAQDEDVKTKGQDGVGLNAPADQIPGRPALTLAEGRG
ncbi:hypothetical protein BG46_23980 [Brucella anthropi]|nr:hypothetical protein BG46_23980 [Brucella anthropi]KIU66716.1 hypothetical protein TR92_18665 [Brucella anthropi]